jgi:hypothetical protein
MTVIVVCGSLFQGVFSLSLKQKSFSFIFISSFRLFYIPVAKLSRRVWDYNRTGMHSKTFYSRNLHRDVVSLGVGHCQSIAF